MEADAVTEGRYARCEACFHTVALADIAPTDPCPRCGLDKMVAIVEVPAPAMRPAEGTRQAVIEELRAWVPGGQEVRLPEMADDILRALAKRGLLTPGDVVVRNARETGLGVLVDGREVEPSRVHLARPAGGEEMPFDLETLFEAARTDPAEFRRKYEAVAARWRDYVQAPADAERRNRVPEDVIDGALKILAEYVTLPYEGRRLVEDAGSPERVRADERNRDMMRRILAPAFAALAEELGDETEPHVCTCGHVPEKGIVGCSEGFGDRCRFELAIRKVVPA